MPDKDKPFADVAASVLNNATAPDPNRQGDGVALSSVSHPLQITDEMLTAGWRAFNDHVRLSEWKPDSMPSDMLTAIYAAMAQAEPVLPDIDDDVLEEIIIAVELPADVVEEFAIRCAKGNNGGEWLKTPSGEQHYTEDQKNYWRNFVRELAASLAYKPRELRVVPREV